MERDLVIQIMYALERRKKALRDKAKEEGRNNTESETLVIATLDEVAFDLLQYIVERS